jgi:NAD(P)-dependent dehydrogenase (short-subunit alcohol dehydrogenase family)
MRTLQGRVAVVTGAGSGIGRATSRLLAERGAELALADVDEAGLAETARLIGDGRRVTTHRVDVSDADRVRRFAQEVQSECGRVHVVVNNAGVSVAASFEEQSLDDFHWLMGINFWGVVYGCKFFLPLLRKVDEAHIVNISSVFGLVGVPMNSSYCSSKFAVRGLSEVLRAELTGTHIGLTCVMPGGVATNIVKNARFVENSRQTGLRERTVRAFERMLPPEKAAELIVRGIERNRPRVLITREAYLIDAVKRVAPMLSSELLGQRWQRFAATRQEKA